MPIRKGAAATREKRENNPFSKIKSAYFDKSLDLRVQSFNLLGFAGMAAGIVVALVSAAIGAGAVSVALNLAASALAFFLLRTTGKWISYRAGCWIVVAAVFMIAFPILFFAAGGYRSGMPCFFVFALIFTAILLDKRERAAALALELAAYAACCLAAYRYPWTVAHFQTGFGYVCDVVTGITVSSVLLHIHIYHVRQTQISELNQELGEWNATLERYNRMKTDFLAAVAHEIRTPLDFIVAGSRDTLDLLEEQPINTGEIMDNQEKIRQRAMRIDGIVMDLMDAVAIENGRLSLSRQLIRLSEFLKSACGAGLNKPDAGDNRVVYDLEPGLPKVWADGARIEQVMTNLISNAVRHTKGGVITVKLARGGKAGKQEKSQIVSVADNGEGMGAEAAEAAFKKYAPPSGREGKHWRHGIGLYVCRQIIAAHGGEIWIDSEKGRGTTVSFSLMEELDDERMEAVDPDSGG